MTNTKRICAWRSSRSLYEIVLTGLCPLLSSAQRSGFNADSNRSVYSNPNRRLFLIDESSLTSTQQMKDFLDRLGPHDRVLLIGDTHQHQAVDAGKPFEQLQDAGMRTAQLDQIMRQKDPELLKAVEHLARNETHTGITLLQAQGRVTELSNPQERIAAIARDYASNPEKTLIVSPDNASRRDINQAVRIELQASGALGKENISFPVLVVRNDMSGADRAWAARYTPGDTVRYIRGSQQLGLGKNTYATVVVTDPANNLVTVVRADGQHVAYDPQRLRGVNVYTNLLGEFSTGDRIQFTHNNKDLDVHNRDRGRIEAIGNHDRLTVKMDDGRTVNFDPARMRHFDHGYAVTSHSSQGLTEDRVLVNMDTNTFSELLNPRFASDPRGAVHSSKASHRPQQPLFNSFQRSGSCLCQRDTLQRQQSD